MYKRIQAGNIADADRQPLINQPESNILKNNAFKEGVNRILEEEKDRDLFEERKILPSDDDQNNKSKRALPKKKKTERDYEKVEQKDD